MDMKLRFYYKYKYLIRGVYLKTNYSVSFLYVYVFLTGAAVMSLEIAASRFLAPYYGTSMIVWANIIGLILLSLSLGYWIGGKWADKRPDGYLLMKLSLFSGIFVSILPLWSKFLFPMLSAGIMNTSIWIIIGSFFAILLVFAPPVFLLAMVSPFAIRLIAKETENLGKVAGNLTAFSTLGSLFGTFGTAFGTIPFLGARETIFLCSSILIIISTVGLWKSPAKKLGIFIIVPVLLYFMTNTKETTMAGEKILWEQDSLYQHIRVTQDDSKDISLVYNEGGGVQSIRRADDSLYHDDYYNNYLLVPFLVDSPKEVLILGSAGGTIPRSMAKYVKPLYPNLNISGVEIDPDVIELSSRFFDLQPKDAKIINQDARVFMNGTNQRYDAVMVDCYSQQIYIPFHLSTVEFFNTIRGKLTKNGVIAMNVNATTPDSHLLTSLAKTLNQVFPYTYTVKARGQYNYMLLGATHPLSTERIAKIDETSPLEEIKRDWPEKLEVVTSQQIQNGEILTDNHAPTEWLTDSMIFSEANTRD